MSALIEDKSWLIPSNLRGNVFDSLEDLQKAFPGEEISLQEEVESTIMSVGYSIYVRRPENGSMVSKIAYGCGYCGKVFTSIPTPIRSKDDSRPESRTYLCVGCKSNLVREFD